MRDAHARRLGKSPFPSLRRILPAAAAVLALLLAGTGCQTRPTPPDRASMPVFPTDPEAVELLKSPILDIHTHNFNARDIPVRNIALARRDSLWLAWVPDGMADLLAAAILAETPPEDPNLRAAHRRKTPEVRARDAADLLGLDQGLTNTITSRAQFGAIQKLLAHHFKTGTNAPPTFGERWVLRSLSAVASGRTDGFLRRDINEVLEELADFVSDLTLSPEELAGRYHQENSTNVQFRIAHMMDMGPTYGMDERSGGEMVPYRAQIQQMARLANNPSNQMAYFVAYNPFRDNLHPGEALETVRHAIEREGAVGVKIYPPAGYRAGSNQIPPRPCCPFTPAPGRQWDRRYTRSGVRLPGAELDGRVLELLRWCATNQIPVFAHSGYGEFQARSGYGQDMPNPAWWRSVLTNHSELKDLRLCFGHSGGGDSWFGATNFASWSDVVVDLCRTYPNVYCEVGCLSGILDATQRRVFAVEMKRLCGLGTNQAHPFAFSSKILYGSDWFMPIEGLSSRRQPFCEWFQSVFLETGLREHYQKFFLQNALSYLNVGQRLTDGNHPLAAETRRQLSQLAEVASRE